MSSNSYIRLLSQYFTRGQEDKASESFYKSQFKADREAAVLNMSPNELALYGTDRAFIDDGFTVLSDPRGPVDLLMADSDPTAVWAWSGIVTTERRSWGFAWQASHHRYAKWVESTDRSAIIAQHRKLSRATSSNLPSLWVSPILFGTHIRERHTGIHWDDCPADCNDAHGWIEIGCYPLGDSVEDRADLTIGSSARREQDAADILEQYAVEADS